MKIRIFSLFSAVLLSFLLLTCGDSTVNDGDFTAINYISHKNSGCLSGSGSLVKENDPTIELNRRGIYLNIILNFTTLCEASFKDSVSISTNEISICLINENPAAMCICPYRDEFNFRVIRGGTFKVSFFLNSLGAEYNLVADTTITI